MKKKINKLRRISDDEISKISGGTDLKEINIDKEKLQINDEINSKKTVKTALKITGASLLLVVAFVSGAVLEHEMPVLTNLNLLKDLLDKREKEN